MAKFLPRDASGGPHPRIQLPISLGGLGLTPSRIDSSWDLDNVLASLSREHLIALTWIASWKQGRAEQPPNSLFRELRRYASNRYARGIREETGLDEIIDLVLEYSPTLSLEEAREEVIQKFRLRPTIGYRQARAYIGKAGRLSRSDIKGILARTNLMTSLMSENPDRGWKPASWEQRDEVFLICLRYILITHGKEYEDVDIQLVYDWLMSYPNGQIIDQEVQPPDVFIHKEASYVSLEEDVPTAEPLIEELRSAGPRLDLPIEAWGSVFKWNHP
jgi:hypothetical protein